MSATVVVPAGAASATVAPRMPVAAHARIAAPLKSGSSSLSVVAASTVGRVPDSPLVDLTPAVVTTLGGALSATLGVLVGGAVARRSQERHWLRDRQLQAYQE